jgi:hypothetical protein
MIGHRGSPSVPKSSSGAFSSAVSIDDLICAEEYFSSGILFKTDRGFDPANVTRLHRWHAPGAAGRSAGGACKS